MMMRTLIISTILLLTVGQTCLAQQLEVLREDSLRIVQLLQDGRQLSADCNLPLFFAHKFLGVPYVAHTLEVNDQEQLVINTRQLDCTTLVENVTALTLCTRQHRYSYADFCTMLTSLRYRQGRLQGYVSRLHYFTDWILDKQSMGYVREIQLTKAPFTSVQTVRTHYMSSHPDAYKALRTHPELVPAIKATEKALTGKQFRFIPKAQVQNTKALREAVHDGDILAIITSKDGLDTSHLGFAVWKKDGLHLLNASMLRHQVVLEPMTLRQYLYKHPTFTGIRVIRIL